MPIEKAPSNIFSAKYREQSDSDKAEAAELAKLYNSLAERYVSVHDKMYDHSKYVDGFFYEDDPAAAEISGYKLTVNKVAEIVDRYVTETASKVDVAVPARSAGVEDRDKANAAEQVLYGIYEANNIDDKNKGHQMYMSSQGTGVYRWYIDPDREEKVIIYNAVPRYCYPSHSAMDVNKLEYVFYRFPLTALQYERMFDDKLLRYGSGIGEGTVEDVEEYAKVYVNEYWDREWQIILLNENQIISRKRHGYGVVPFYFTSNGGQPHRIFGVGDIEHIVALNEYYNNLLSQFADSLEYYSNPMLYTKGYDGEVEPGPGGWISLPQHADIGFVQHTGHPPDMQQQMSRIEQSMREISGVQDFTNPGALPDRSSGNTLNGLMVQMRARVADKQERLSNTLKMMNRDILSILSRKFPEMKLEYTTMKKDSFASVSVIAKDLKGSERSFVSFQPSLADRQGQITMQLQKFQAGIQSRRTTMEKCGIPDPELERDQMTAELMEDMIMQQEGQLAQGIIQGGELDPAQVERQLRQIEKGGVATGPRNRAPSPGPQNAPGAPQTGRQIPQGGGAPEQGVGGDLVAQIRAIDGLTGKVFLAQDKDGGVVVAATKPSDVKKIKEVVSGVKVIRVRKQPSGESQRIV